MDPGRSSWDASDAAVLTGLLAVPETGGEDCSRL